MLKYVLEDFLDLEAGLNGEKTRRVKELLLSRRLGDYDVWPLEGFLLDNHLVVIEERDPDSLEQLVFVDPRDGSVRIRPLKSRRPASGHPAEKENSRVSAGRSGGGCRSVGRRLAAWFSGTARSALWPLGHPAPDGRRGAGRTPAGKR